MKMVLPRSGYKTIKYHPSTILANSFILTFSIKKYYRSIDMDWQKYIFR